MSKRLEDLRHKIRSFLLLKKKWDKKEAHPISVLAVENAELFIEYAHQEFKPLSMNPFPSIDGGIKIEVIVDEVEIDFHFTASGRNNISIKNTTLLPKEILVFILNKL